MGWMSDTFGGVPHVWNPGSWGGTIDAYTGKAQSDATREANAGSMAMAEKNIQLQREFAQHGIRWRVEDAKAAGINPLAALGAQGSSFSPVSVGLTPDTAQADATVRMGQDITRAMQATRTLEERQMAQLQVQGAQLDVQGKALDNQIKNSQLQKMGATGPAFPGSKNFISGQGDSGSAIVEKPLERTASLPGSPQAEPGAIPDVGWAKTATGLVPVPSSDVKQRIEDNMPHEWSHFLRNNLSPDTKPPNSALPKGSAGWKWNQMKMEWQPRYPEGKPAYRDRAYEQKRYYKEGA